MNRKKLSLESLEVQSFHTGRAEAPGRGTVRANAGGYVECTYDRSCACETSPWFCGTAPETESCGYTVPGLGCDSWISERPDCV